MWSDEEQRFQHALAFHCAPALLGAKPADLISWSGPIRESRALVERYGTSLSEAGVSLCLLSQREGRSLLLVYRRDRLAAQLERPEVRAQLARDGYPVERGPEAMLNCLSTRLTRPDDFPHEVGLFLGYPAADVEGFRLHHGQDYLYSGVWKVYSDVEGAKRAFARYRRCRSALSGRMAAGQSLTSVFSSVKL